MELVHAGLVFECQDESFALRNLESADPVNG
jgi:hypothetical protein